MRVLFLVRIVCFIALQIRNNIPFILAAESIMSVLLCVGVALGRLFVVWLRILGGLLIILDLLG